MGEGRTKTVRLTERTAASFGYEWSRFHEYTDAYRSNFWESVYPVTPAMVAGKYVLDAGCGAGRYTRILADHAAFVLGFDLSQKAVDSARENTRWLPNVCIDRENVYNLPLCWLWESGFDRVFSIGVLHHLPDPEEGFRRLVDTVKPGGSISIWVYGRKDNWLALNLYEPIRKVTTKIPHGILYRLSWLPAALVQACNVARVPLFAQYRRFPFRTKWNDAFDVLSAPSARYYDLDEIRGWYERTGLREIRVCYRMMNGKAKGIRGYGVR